MTSPAYEGAFRFEAAYRKGGTVKQTAACPVKEQLDCSIEDIEGFYLIFFPPNHLRVAPYGEAGDMHWVGYDMKGWRLFSIGLCQEDDRGIADFTLVDFGVMFKFIEMEEVPKRRDV